MSEHPEVEAQVVVLEGDIIERAVASYSAARAERIKAFAEVRQLRAALAQAEEGYVKAAVAVDGAWTQLAAAHNSDSPPRADGKPVVP